MIGALTGAVVALVLLAVSLWGLVLDARAQAVAERARVADLLSRLAARTPGEYAAFAAQPAHAPEPEAGWLYDPTGMIEVQVDA